MADLDPYLERLLAAKEIAASIITLCESYEKGPTQTAINRFLVSVERLADLAEDIEVMQTLRALDS
jgi:hypothetical protein